MPLTNSQRELASSDPVKLTAYQRGQLRALLIGADRVEAQRLIDRRQPTEDENDGAGPTPLQRGAARGRAVEQPPSVYSFKTFERQPDTRLD